MTNSHPILEIEGITKTFSGVVANADISLTLNEGEIHCLLGENGAGKSVLMSVVFGLYRPDSGQVKIRGEIADFKGTAQAIEHGIGMVHQHFQLIPVFTVAENIVLGDETTRGPMLDMDTARERIKEISAVHGLTIDPDAMVGDLSVGEQQRVELIKALYRDADILILDEPTAVLTPGEADNFFEVVRSLVAEGKSIIFITHKLREVLAIADDITVLRRGKVAGRIEPTEATEASLAKLMVGRDVVLRVDKGDASVGEPMLRVENLSVRDDRDLVAIDDLSLEVHAGEIFGVAGVEGNGQRELVEALAGMRAKSGGTVRVGDLDITNMSVRKIAEHGVGHVPEDRNKHGLVGEFSVADNAVLNHYHRKEFSRRGLRDEDAIRRHARELVEEFDVRTSSVDVAVSTLSGGNQQKVIIAREFDATLRCLLVAQPTRGVDVGSIEFIHNQLIALRDAGVAVLLVSAELDEVMSLSDRIGVLFRGELVGVFDGATADRFELGHLMATGGVSHLATSEAS